MTTQPTARFHEILMCRPDHFDVTYRINPWMDTDKPVDRDLAVLQWEQLRDAYREAGHTVHLVEAQPSLPDMVFAANAAIVHKGRALVSRFRFAERNPEVAAYTSWLADAGYEPVRQAESVNEGQGDYLSVGNLMLAGTGYRSSLLGVGEVSGYFGMPVLPLELVDPRFYHLDTALCVLDESMIAFFPGAFSTTSVAVLLQQFPDALLVSEEDAAVLGLNAFSDGARVFLPSSATGFRAQLQAAGFDPVGLDLSELLRAGGGIKCCTLTLSS